MTVPLTIAWSIYLLTEASLVLRLWHRLRGIYSGFLAYLAADAVGSVLLLTLAFILPTKPYTMAWIAIELLLAFAGIWISAEAVWRMMGVRRFMTRGSYLPEIISVAVLICGICAAVGGRLLASPQQWDSALEPACAVKASLEMFLCLFITSLIFEPRKLKLLASLEYRHAVMLAIYFGINSVSYFLVMNAYSNGKTPGGTALMLMSAGCFAAWFLLFSKFGKSGSRGGI